MKELSETARKVMKVFEDLGVRENDYLSKELLLRSIQKWSETERCGLEEAIAELRSLGLVRPGKRLGILLTTLGHSALFMGSAVMKTGAGTRAR